MKTKLSKVIKRTKENYGMYASDWYIVGLDENGKQVEGWESEFELPTSNFISQCDATVNSHKQLEAFMNMMNPWSEDRSHRFGMRTYNVRVYIDGEEGFTLYTVNACSPISARCIAFLLDGGCEPGLSDFDAGHVELALTWTEVVE